MTTRNVIRLIIHAIFNFGAAFCMSTAVGETAMKINGTVEIVLTRQQLEKIHAVLTTLRKPRSDAESVEVDQALLEIWEILDPKET